MADTNELIHKANQMGLIDTKLQTYYYNASNCLTKAAVRETNIKQSGGTRVLRIENISGMLLILPIGLGGALLVFLAEHIYYISVTNGCKIYKKKDSIKTKGQLGGNRPDWAINKDTAGRGNGKHNQTAAQSGQKWAEVSHIFCVFFLIFGNLFWAEVFANLIFFYRQFRTS